MMDDLISRQAAIDVAVNYHCDHDITIIPNTRWTDGFKTGWNLRENDIIHGLEELPPAQPDTPMRGSKVAETVGNGTDRTTGDCISRQAAIDELMETVEDHRSDQFGGALLHWTGVKAILTGLPSAQPERKTGRWIPVTKIYETTDEDFPEMHIKWVDAIEPDEEDAVRCSECNTVFGFDSARNWCSQCGARMKGGDAT